MGLAEKKRICKVRLVEFETFRTASSRPRVSPKLVSTSACGELAVSVCEWLQGESLKIFSASLRFHCFQGFNCFCADAAVTVIRHATRKIRLFFITPTLYQKGERN